MTEDPSPTVVSSHYLNIQGAEYFAYQNSGQLQQGQIEARKFSRLVQATDTVLDFGCGSGSMLAALACARRIGVEVNPAAQASCRELGIEVHDTLIALPDGVVDVVVSNHALEHVLSPLDTLQQLKRVLRENGMFALYVPIDDWRTEQRVDEHDINHHLYTWTPLLLGNLLFEAGFKVRSVNVVNHAWPPNWQRLDRMLPVKLFDAICWTYSVRVKRRQLFALAAK
jgi:SAM-dependent methyltransferase